MLCESSGVHHPLKRKPHAKPQNSGVTNIESGAESSSAIALTPHNGDAKARQGGVEVGRSEAKKQTNAGVAHAPCPVGGTRSGTRVYGKPVAGPWGLIFHLFHLRTQTMMSLGRDGFRAQPELSCGPINVITSGIRPATNMLAFRKC